MGLEVLMGSFQDQLMLPVDPNGPTEGLPQSDWKLNHLSLFYIFTRPFANDLFFCRVTKSPKSTSFIKNLVLLPVQVYQV